MVDWIGEAEDNDGAAQSALLFWDEKYGPGKRPAPAKTTVKPLEP
jgi:hypothetical protein